MDSKINRRYERKDYQSKERLQVGNKSYIIKIENISLSGGLISTDGINQIDFEDEIILKVPFANQENMVELKGRVTRFTGGKAGIEFF